jgi:hypothetical protein
MPAHAAEPAAAAPPPAPLAADTPQTTARGNTFIAPAGWTLRSLFQRKLLEVLFDGQPEADARIAAAAQTCYTQLAAERERFTVPADAAAAAGLAARYKNAALGEIAVSHDGSATRFDFGEWKSEVASRKNPDGTTSFLTIVPGMTGFEFVVGSGSSGQKRTLVTRDAQHEYVFEEVARPVA